jgi:hypothetical protein
MFKVRRTRENFEVNWILHISTIVNNSPIIYSPKVPYVISVNNLTEIKLCSLHNPSQSLLISTPSYIDDYDKLM